MMNVLVVGASRGIGLEFVRRLRERGDAVIGTARSSAGRARIAALGAEALELDVVEEGAFERLAETLGARDLDLALLVAGDFGSKLGATEAPRREDFDRVMRTNVFGPLQAIPSLAPRLAPRKGRLVAISSDMGSIGNTEASQGLVYRASKAALNMVIRGAALDHPEVTFLALSPGWVRTDMGGPEAPLSPEQSIGRMLEVIDGLDPSASGAFLGLDGKPLPW